MLNGRGNKTENPTEIRDERSSRADRTDPRYVCEPNGVAWEAVFTGAPLVRLL